MKTTAPAKLPIFRSKTLQKYMQNKEKNVLPRIATPPVFVFGWIILVLLLASGVTVWQGQIPTYITGSGIILDTHNSTNQRDDATAALLLSASAIAHIHSGLPVQVQIGQAGPLLHRTIDQISPSPLSPNAIRQKYGFEVTDPSLVVIIGLGSAVSKHLYVGSPIRAQIQIGSQSLLTLFPGIHGL